MASVRTPLEHGTALALGNKRYRKQVLRVGDLHYQGGTFPITDDYLNKVVTAFDARAVAAVPFQLADHSNRHTEDPERRRGTITALHRTPDGLDAVIELDDDGAALLDKYPDLGVSVLIKHDRTTGEGAHYPAVLAHVLGTTDPVLTKLEPWREEIAASNDAGEVLDLLALTSAPEGGNTPPIKEPRMADAVIPTPEELAQLRSLLAKFGGIPAEVATEEAAPAAQAAAVEDPAEARTEETEDGLTPDDIAALVDAQVGETAEEPELVAAANDSPDVLALSQEVAAERRARQELELRLAQSEAREAAAAYLAERTKFAQDYGIPPQTTNIIRPLLEGRAGTEFALSNGTTVDAGSLIRQFIAQVATMPRLDLSQAAGSALDFDPDGEDARTRENDDFFARAKAELNN